MNKKIIILIFIVAILILLIPIPRHLKDGGTIEYQSLTYKISKVKSLTGLSGYEKGTIVEIFGIEIYNNVKEENEINSDESENDRMEYIKVIINNQEYDARIENNETAASFINKLPQELEMNELNGNEKYVYMDYQFPTNPSNPKNIEAGDIMLYGNNCLVVFYKSFKTNYSYTKIGHIDKLPDLGNDSLTIKFEK